MSETLAGRAVRFFDPEEYDRLPQGQFINVAVGSPVEILREYFGISSISCLPWEIVTTKRLAFVVPQDLWDLHAQKEKLQNSRYSEKLIKANVLHDVGSVMTIFPEQRYRSSEKESSVEFCSVNEVEMEGVDIAIDHDGSSSVETLDIEFSECSSSPTKQPLNFDLTNQTDLKVARPSNETKRLNSQSLFTFENYCKDDMDHNRLNELFNGKNSIIDCSKQKQRHEGKEEENKEVEKLCSPSNPMSKSADKNLESWFGRQKLPGQEIENKIMTKKPVPHEITSASLLDTKHSEEGGGKIANSPAQMSRGSFLRHLYKELVNTKSRQHNKNGIVYSRGGWQCHIQPVKGSTTNFVVQKKMLAQKHSSLNKKTSLQVIKKPLCKEIQKELDQSSNLEKFSSKSFQWKKWASPVKEDSISEERYELNRKYFRDFIRSNALYVIRKPPRKAQPFIVDDVRGTRKPYSTSPLLKAVFFKTSMGEIPEYLKKRNTELGRPALGDSARFYQPHDCKFQLGHLHCNKCLRVIPIRKNVLKNKGEKCPVKECVAEFKRLCRENMEKKKVDQDFL